MHRALRTCALASLAATATHGVASAPGPDHVFVQRAVADRTDAWTIGASWHWPWQRAWSDGTWSGYSEVVVGRWTSRGADGRASAWVTQLGVTPVLRYTPRADDPAWYVELGIGLNVITPLYRGNTKRFSTAFNFGDHVAVGWRFGERRQQELSLRIQHFSNAGIKRPNPGEDFLQLRYGWRFGAR